MNDAALLDNMTDYADEFGDQKLISLIDSWMEKKMGKPNTDAVKVLMSVQDQLAGLNKELRSLDYTMAITDAMMIVLKEMAKI